MKLRKCDKKYWGRVLTLRNENRHFFGNTNWISSAEHERFMEMHSDNYRVYVESRGPYRERENFIGFVGHVGGDIRICVCKEDRDRGVASEMLKEFLKEFPDCHAKVKIENTASLKLFEKFGFVKKYFVLEQPENVGESK